MNSSLTALLFGGLIVFVATFSAGPAAAERIRFERESNVLYLHCDDVAAALDFELKVVHPQRLVTFCQGGAAGICIPVRLTADNHRRTGTDLLIEAEALAGALRFRVRNADATVTIERQVLSDNSPEQQTPAYNANWDHGRGFGKGDTLPDIPLVDLQGNEVRFSQFLGKRYILYCWASW